MYFTRMPGSSFSGPLPPLSEKAQLISQRIKKHVNVLAEDIGERNIWQYSNLEAASDYIIKEFSKYKYKISIQEYKVNEVIVKNIEARNPGTLSDEIILIGAHYDSVIDCPGANDNGSAVAAILEIARLLADRSFPRTICFTAFVNEEPPFFQTDHMGSLVYAKQCRKRGENIKAMISVETIGYYSDEPGSQKYPFPFSLFYPDKGNFIGFVGNQSSGKLVRKCVASFRRHTAFPSEGLAAPGWITGVGWSDQWSFWQEGYPGIMVTDTAPYRYPYYHTPEDTPDKIDYDRTARVIEGLAKTAAELAEGI